MVRVWVSPIICPLFGVKNEYVLFIYLFIMENNYKCPHFGSIETIFECQTQWDNVQISSQNEKTKLFNSSCDFKYAQVHIKKLLICWMKYGAQQPNIKHAHL
jgi:hypothetical protein